MLAGVAVVPTAPLLIPGVSAALPAEVSRVASASRAALTSLPAADATLLLAAAGPTPCCDGEALLKEPGFCRAASAALAGIGRPDLARPVVTPRRLLDAAVARLHLPVHDLEELPLGLAVLALAHAASQPLLPLAVAPGWSFDRLAAVGSELVEALAEVRWTVVAAGDLSAGLATTSPLHLVPGAAEWDARALSVADSGRLRGLERLGPEEAARVGALGWGPLAVLHGLLATTKVGLVVRHYSAPLGVGYLVAQGG